MALVASSALGTASARQVGAAGVAEQDGFREQTPDPAKVLSTLRSSHPRLLLDQSGLQNIRDRVVRDPTAKAYLAYAAVKSITTRASSVEAKYDVTAARAVASWF